MESTATYAILDLMQKRLSKPRKSKDVNEIAFGVMQKVIQESEREESKLLTHQSADPVNGSEEHPKNNPHAVILGRRGGKVGGPARAAKLSAEERSQIALRAARARWAKKV